jgi:hypothetical protein
MLPLHEVANAAAQGLWLVRVRDHPAPSPYAGAGRGSLACVGLAWPRHVFQ